MRPQTRGQGEPRQKTARRGGDNGREDREQGGGEQIGDVEATASHWGWECESGSQLKCVPLVEGGDCFELFQGTSVL